MQTILIIDDSFFMRLSLKKLLGTSKYRVIESSGGEEALKLFASDKPDLVLLDIVMPEMRGLEVLERIKKEDPKVKVIMITAVGQEAVMEECKKLGVVDYIKKPFDEDRVKTAVTKCLA